MLLGYTTAGSRAFLTDVYDFTNQEHSLFVQDDWKVSSGVTVNAGLRYEVYVPDTEREDRLPNYDVGRACGSSTPARTGPPCARTSRRAGATSPRASAWPGTSPATRGTCCAPATAAASSRCRTPPATCCTRTCPNQVSQNYSVETNPLVFTPDRVPRLSNPFPAPVPLKPRTTAELNAANPVVFGHAFSNETPHMDTWQVSYERQLTNTMMAEVAYVGQQGLEPHLGRQHQRGPAGPGHAGVAPADPAAVERGHDQLLRPHQQLELQQPAGEAEQALLAAGCSSSPSYTFGKSLDYAGSPASGGGAVGGPQSVTLFDESRGPSGFDVKHRFVLSYVWELPFGEGRRWANGGIGKPLLGDWQFSGIVTLSHGPALHGLPQHRRQQRGAVVAEPDRRREARQPDAPSQWFDIDDFVAPPPNTYGDSGRGVLYSPGTQTFDVSLPARFPIKGRFRCSSGPTPSTCSTRPSSASRTQNIGSPTAGRITTTTSTTARCSSR